MHMRTAHWIALALLAAGCGGDTSAFTTTTSDGGPHGSGGSSPGGSANAGGSGQSNGGSGQSGAGGSGQAGAGGSGVAGAGGSGVSGAGGSGQAGAGGSSGSGGTPVSDAGPCAAPVNQTDTAICLTFSPEKIQVEADPTLDERGEFIVQIFDTPNPPKQNASQVALFERVLPANSGTGGQIALDALRPIRAVAAFPSTVYIRALFIDNPGPFATGDLGYGSWIGGLNFLDGIQKNEPVLPVTLQQGQGNTVDLALTALRKLDVTVHTTATPIGDGQGPLSVVVVNDPDPTKKPPPVGAAVDKCADVTQGDIHLTGFFVGSGQHWITGILKDLGGTGDVPPGSLAALTVNGGTLRIPTQFNAAPTAYTASVTIDLSYVVPLPADAGTPPPNSCADLGITGDAGP